MNVSVFLLGGRRIVGWSEGWVCGTDSPIPAEMLWSHVIPAHSGLVTSQVSRLWHELTGQGDKAFPWCSLFGECAQNYIFCMSVAADKCNIPQICCSVG